METTRALDPYDTVAFQVGPTMKMRTPTKPAHCPWCGSAKIALLLSGMPVFLPELENALDGGGIAIGSLGGGNDAPAWQCTDCCAHFFRTPATPA